MGDWADAVLQFVGAFPHGRGGLMYMVMLAAVVFLVFLAVYARGAGTEVGEDGEDREVHTD